MAFQENKSADITLQDERYPSVHPSAKGSDEPQTVQESAKTHH